MRWSASHSLAVITALAVFSSSGCDKLRATTLAVSVVTRTPELADAQGWDADLAGVLATDDLPLAVTAGLVAVMERESVTSTTAPKPIAGATVRIGWSNKSVTLCAVDDPDAAGTYQASSLPAPAPCSNPTFTYEVGAEYETTIVTADDTHTLTITAPDRVDPTKVDFTPTPTNAPAPLESVRQHSLGEALTVAWDRDAEAADKNTFLTVLRIDYNGANNDPSSLLNGDNWQPEPTPVYDTMPREAGEIIDLITQQPETSHEIPATVFDRKGLYILVVTATGLSSDTSSSLSIGSGAMAGIGTAFLFFVQ